jgi:hypothetical protein
MIQLNLLPDVKLEYIKAQRTRSVAITIAVLFAIAAVGLLILLLSVSGLQKKHLDDLSNDIKSQSKKLQTEPDISKILTVQNQLQSLTGLHAAKPAASRLSDYLNQVTPAQVNISDFTADLAQQTATITGSADSLSNVNKYVDTLKFTKFSDGAEASSRAFSNVVLNTFGVTAGGKDPSQAVTYTITLSYDRSIFDITKDIQLSVPNQTTTRASVDQPPDLFQSSPKPSTNGGR